MRWAQACPLCSERVGQVGNLQRVGNPPGRVEARRGAGCQPTRRMPSWPHIQNPTSGVTCPPARAAATPATVPLPMRLAPLRGTFLEPTLAANLERSKILEPPAFWSIRFRLPPELEPAEIFSGDLALGRAFQQMVPEGRRQTSPLDLRHPPMRRRSTGLVPA
jgi:hypothetical protein